MERRNRSVINQLTRLVIDVEKSVSEMLSKNFSRKELCCPDCGRCVVDMTLILALEKMRTLAGKPITIISGYRCPDHNTAVGGAGKSQHCEGKAADIVIIGMSVNQMYQLAMKVEDFAKGGVGAYSDGHLHVDVRGTYARWSFHDDKYCSISDLVQV